MKTYTIKKNDFAIGQAKGKNNAIKRINMILDWDGVPANKRKWNKSAGTITCIVDEDKYEII